jgi:alpha-L-rhamnosidase
VPGFRNVIVRPQPVGDLSWVEASYASVRGTVSVRWEHRGGRFMLKVTVPPNTTATVFMPSGDGDVAEGGGGALGRPGVAFVGRHGDRSEYSIASGSYSFNSAW